jgi:drug/metabolite transporter (DMT)-like permease
MDLRWFCVVLFAALLHATWNALVKVSADRLVVLTAVSAGQGLVGLVAIPLVGFPDRRAWPYIGISALLNYAYCAFVFQAYRFGDLSKVYPLARGIAPLLVVGGAYLVVGEVPGVREMLGIVLVSIGILFLGILGLSRSRQEIASSAFALATGAMIAGYTVSDGAGVRLSSDAFAYIAGLFVLELPVVVFTAILRGRRMITAMHAEKWKFGGSALASTLAYGLVILASAHAPLALVSALRETSVIIASVIGVTLLTERPWRLRVGAACIVAAGIFLIVSFG